jgi:hypothetical protein
MTSTELQVTLEVALDVDTVYNLDLFQKGWYQLRISTIDEKCWECFTLPSGPKEKVAHFGPVYIRYRREERKLGKQKYCFREKNPKLIIV